MPEFTFYADPTKKLKGNIFECVRAVGQLCANGLTTLQQIRETLYNNTGSGPTVVNQLANLSSAGTSIQVALEKLTRAIETVGKETLTSEVVVRLREENARLEGVVAGLQKQAAP